MNPLNKSRRPRPLLFRIRVIGPALLLLAGKAPSADLAEHREFSRAALDSALSRCGPLPGSLLEALFIHQGKLDAETPLYQGKSFAELSARFSGKDLSRARAHHRGETVLQQLRQLPASLISSAWQAVESSEAAIPVEQKDRHVLVNYLLHHLLALRFAERAAHSSAGLEDLRRAFVYEAMAQSYLQDAFSAAHILLEIKAFSALQATNYSKAHAFFNSKGVFVVNSAGDAWQAFGDGLLLWRQPAYEHLLRACATSLEELLLVFFSEAGSGEIPECLRKLHASLPPEFPAQTWLEDRPGSEYYEKLRMPSLLSLPMPMAATWSKQEETVDAHGIHRRGQRPQLRESGLHDPDDAGIDLMFLPPRQAVPDWLVFDEFKGVISSDSTRKLIRENPAFASVRYIQTRRFSPAYAGFLFSAAGGIFVHPGTEGAVGAGIGYGVLDRLLLLANVSLDLRYVQMGWPADRQYLATSVGGGLHFALPRALRLLDTFRFEMGNAWEWGSRFDLFDSRIAVGVELPSLPLGFTYAGLKPRLMFQRIDTGATVSAFYLQIVLH